MKKKFQKISEYTSPSSTKFTVACLGKSSGDLFSGCDELKSLYIWKKGREIPILNLSGLNTIVTSLTFNSKDTELYAGSKGGLVIILDLNSSKVRFNLEAHSSVCTQLAITDNDSQILASGASDGKVKIWDLRMKTCINTLKSHSDCIKAISISNDNAYIATGGEDCYVKLWDMRKFKFIKDFHIMDQTTINCIEFNPYNINFVYGSNDKTLKHWDLERYDLLSITPPDKLPILQAKFESSGKKVFYATNEYVKLLNVEWAEPVITDIIEAGWGKLYDMKVFENDGLYGINIYSNKIGFWKFDYDLINFNSSTPKLKEKQESPKKYDNLIDLNSDYLSNNVYNNLQIIIRKVKKINDLDDKQNVFIKNGMNIAMENNQKVINMQDQLNKNEKLIKKDIDEEIKLNLPISLKNQDLVNVSTTFINFKDNEPVGLDLNNFNELNESINMGYSNDLSVITELGDQHNVFKGVISKRINSLRMVSKWWTESNISSALNSIMMMKDNSVINDFFGNAFARDDTNQLPLTLDHCLIIIPNSLKLISSKYSPYSKVGIKTILNMLKIFSERITTAKNVILNNGVDLAREERLKKCDMVIEQFESVLNSHNLHKIMLKNNELSILANNLSSDLDLFIKSCKKNFTNK